MNRSIVVALLLMIGASSTLESQQRDRTGDVPGPISTLLSMEHTLGLTEPQVTQLLAIESRLDGLNQPHVSRLVGIHGRIKALGPRASMTPEQRALFDSYVAEARPLMREISKNNGAAMKEVGEVLTPQQKETIARLLREREKRERSDSDSRTSDRGN